jgi:hypothetical protein
MRRTRARPQIPRAGCGALKCSGGLTPANRSLADRSRDVERFKRIAAFKIAALFVANSGRILHTTRARVSSVRVPALDKSWEEWRSLHCYCRGTFECCGNTKLRLCLSRKLKGERALVAEMVESLTNQIARLSQPDVGERVIAAAALLAFARRVYFLGLRACHAIAWP